MEIQENILIDFVSNICRLLLESGAETSRVEDTAERIIRHFHNGKSEVLVMMTGIFITVGDYTAAVRVKKRTINLDKVAKINALSRNITSNRLDFPSAVRRFDEIKTEKPYPLKIKTFSVALCCAFFTHLFGGTLPDSVNSLIVGGIVNVLIASLRNYGTAEFITTLSGGAVTALCVSLLYVFGLGESINPIITGAIMPLVPGLAVTNGIRDITDGDYISGGARLFDAVIVAVALAVGAGSVMYCFGYMTGGIMK